MAWLGGSGVPFCLTLLFSPFYVERGQDNCLASEDVLASVALACGIWGGASTPMQLSGDLGHPGLAGHVAF